MNRMSAQDAMFLHVENDVTPMHIGGVSIFEGPPPAFAELTAMDPAIRYRHADRHGGLCRNHCADRRRARRGRLNARPR